MERNSAPPFIPEPFANSAPGTLVTYPLPDSVTSGSGNAGWNLGWQAVNAEPAGSGGIPPTVSDVNGALKMISATAQFASVQGIPIWSSVVSLLNDIENAGGGYPENAVVQSPSYFGRFYMSTADNNVTNPDTGGAGWVVILEPSVPQRSYSGQGAIAISANSTYTLSQTFTVAGAGHIWAHAKININNQPSGTGTVGVTCTLANTLTSDSEQDTTSGSAQTHDIVFAVSSGNTGTITLTINGTSGLAGTLAASAAIVSTFHLSAGT